MSSDPKSGGGPQMKATLGLTGLTMNAMALIAPGAFLWLTFQIQSAYGAPMAGSSIWFGIVFALVLCFATAISYAELSKLYPGAGSSYFFAEQAFLSKTHAYKFARLAKFIIGWASHLYYWVYPGVMVGVTAMIGGYMLGNLWPATFNIAFNSPTFMMGFCVLFAFGVSYIAYRGVAGTTGVNIAINVIQISALLVFAVIAVGYRASHGEGSVGYTLDPDGSAINYTLATFTTAQFDDKNNPLTYSPSDSKWVLNPKNLTWDPQQSGWVDAKGLSYDPDQKKWIDDKKVVVEKPGLRVIEKPELTAVDNPTKLPVDSDGKAIALKDGNLPAAAIPSSPDKKGAGIAVLDAGGDPQKDPDGAWMPLLKPSDPKAEFPFGGVRPYAADEQAKKEQQKLALQPFILHYADDKGKSQATTQELKDSNDPTSDKQETRQYFDSPKDVVAPHNFSYIIIQACVAILILVGFESVTSMGEEAKNAKRDIPRAVLLSLFVQGCVCYLIEYFAAKYALNPGYKMTTAAGATAPIGDLMKITGAWLFGSSEAGWWFMFIQAITVFLALIGTTLSCISTGARVTYAMGRDEEMPAHFGMLHGKNLTPHRAIWTLATLSAIIGIVAVSLYLCSPTCPDFWGSLTDAQKGSIWYPKFLIPSVELAHQLPNSLLVVTLASNFGTFMLYMLTCVVAIVAFREHHSFHGFKHMVVPVFGLLANFACMLFYLIGPFMGIGMTKAEPFTALGIAALWGLYGGIYFILSGRKRGKTTLLRPEHKAAAFTGAAN